MHLHDTADTFRFSRECIENIGSLFEFAGIDSSKGQGAVFVIHDLERQRSQRLVNINFGHVASLVAFEIDFRLRLNFSRRRKIVHNCV